MSGPDVPEKPKPKTRFIPVAELRKLVTARHKYIAGSKPTAEAAALIQEEYGADAGSSLAFVRWLKGEAEEGGPGSGSRVAIERRHMTADPETGEQGFLETEPGSIPPRPL